MSTWLESSRGKRANFIAISGISGVAAILAAAGFTATAARLLAAADALVGFVFAIAFWICGRSLLGAIQVSLQRFAEARQYPGSAEDPTLLAARKKVVRVVGFFVQQCVMGASMLLFAAASSYGAAAPLLLLCTPMAMPQAWSIVAVQLFAGRSKLRPTSPGVSPSGSPTSRDQRRPRSPLDVVKDGLCRVQRQHQVVPNEASTTSLR